MKQDQGNTAAAETEDQPPRNVNRRAPRLDFMEEVVQRRIDDNEELERLEAEKLVASEDASDTDKVEKKRKGKKKNVKEQKVTNEEVSSDDTPKVDKDGKSE